jgi:hypothetical protein
LTWTRQINHLGSVRRQCFLFNFIRRNHTESYVRWLQFLISFQKKEIAIEPTNSRTPPYSKKSIGAHVAATTTHCNNILIRLAFTFTYFTLLIIWLKDSSSFLIIFFIFTEIDRCAESCHRAISTEYNAKKSRIHNHHIDSISLASSAVDAMFTFRNPGDEDKGSNGTESTSCVDSEWTGSGKNEEEQNHMQNMSHDYMTNKPRRLPPLIQSLVGTHNISPNSGNSENNRSRLIPVKRKHYLNSDEIKRVTESQNHYKENSVAKVAAAAAAAVWLEAEGSVGRANSRMKSYNEEWDEALRWISTWGQNHHNSHYEDNSTGASSMRRETGDSNEEGARVRQSEKQELGYNYNRVQGQSTTSGDRYFDQLLDICNTECQREQTEMISKRESHVTPLSMGISQIFSSMQSSQKIIMKPYSPRVRHNVIGIVLSTAFIWLLRNASYWWKLNRYSTTLQQLLREESEANASSTVPKTHTNRPSNKKHKKKRKKRGDNRSLVHSHDAVMPPDQSIAGEERWKLGEEDSDSDDSFHHAYLAHGGLRRHANTMDSNSDQASKGTISTASHTTSDSQSNAVLKISKLERKCDSKTESSQKLAQPKPSTLNSYGCKRTYPVPTETQREEAYQKLRAFQQVKLKKLIEHNRKLKSGDSVVANRRLTMKEIVLKNIPSKVNQSTVSKRSIPRPPDHSLEADAMSRASQDPSADADLFQVNEENDVDLMVSNILDDDDVNAVSHHSGCNSNSNLIGEAVALGDLLIQNSISNVPSPSRPMINPWSNFCQRGNSNSTNLETRLNQEGNISADANIQLQVSAPEFLPSWGRVKSDASPKIW